MIQEEQFQEAYQVSASLVKMYGEKYLPIFKRMHDENASRDARHVLIGEAYAAAEKAQ